jgi:hypothetical protein
MGDAMTDQTDAETGMSWWNALTDHVRAEWMRRAGNTGRASDAWEAFKRQQAADRTAGGSAI